MIAPVLGGEYIAVISNYLNISSVWKLPVVSCVCVAEAQMRVFNSFVSRVKRIHLQHQKCLSPAQNMFVTSGSEVSTRDHLVTSKKRTRLQCDITFRGETSCI